MLRTIAATEVTDMAFNAYAQRPHETLRTWHTRLLLCPLIGAESIATISSISGARVLDLEIHRTEMRIHGAKFPQPIYTPMLGQNEPIAVALALDRYTTEVEADSEVASEDDQVW